MTSSGEPGALRATIAGLFRKQDDPYAGADLTNARRLGALLYVIGGAIALVIVPLAPPTAAIGRAGWLVAAPVVGGAFAAAVWVLRGGPAVTFNKLLVAAYAGIAQIAVMEWLTGGYNSPYHHLYLMSVVFAAGIHPPQRVYPVLVTVMVAAAAPLVYGTATSVAAASLIAEALLWIAWAFAMMVLMATVRSQRVSLREGEEKAQRLARVDALTGLCNRRAFDEALTTEMARAARTGRSLSVAILDIDDFKEINDRYGHLNGDECLCQVAGTLKRLARVADICFRWGGDEFALLLADTDHPGAERVCRRLCAAVGGSCFRPDGRPLRITCGVAELTHGVGAEDFLAAADLALMAAKKAGAMDGAEYVPKRATRHGGRHPHAARGVSRAARPT